MPITAGELYAHTHTETHPSRPSLRVYVCVGVVQARKETERKRESTTVHSRQAGPKAQSTSANKQYKQKHEQEVCV